MQIVGLKKSWLTPSFRKKFICCFPCILLNREDAWAKSWITDLKHLSERVAKHEASYVHIANKLQLETLEKVNGISSLNYA